MAEADAVALYESRPSATIKSVATDLGVNPETLRNTSRQLRTRIGALDCRPSMGRTGSCFDNTAAESFWADLKEEIDTRFWPDRATARAGIFDFVETFYNRRRLRKHVHWSYLTPHETRLRYKQDQTPG
ncbi:IS3 family transposase [Streptomyces sp. NPDC006602]|uniref:IS3 family transposase n=1 Tax=Streptomyces sp. NPDC006602 TaxID=3364751 RepID=UPI003689BE83